MTDAGPLQLSGHPVSSTVLSVLLVRLLQHLHGERRALHRLPEFAV